MTSLASPTPTPVVRPTPAIPVPTSQEGQQAENVRAAAEKKRQHKLKESAEKARGAKAKIYKFIKDVPTERIIAKDKKHSKKRSSDSIENCARKRTRNLEHFTSN